MSNQDNIHVLSRAAIIHDDKILLCKTLDLEVSFYFLPGGHIEHGATIIQLTTNKERPDARKFYEKLGFKATHEGMKLYLE